MPNDSPSSTVPGAASHQSRGRSKSRDRHKKDKKRKHASSDRDKDKDAKKRKKDWKEKKKSHHKKKKKKEKERKKDLLEKLIEEGQGQSQGQGQGQCQDKANQRDEVKTDEAQTEQQQRPADCHQVTASVIGQIRVTEQTRRRIADGASASIGVEDSRSNAKDGFVIIGSFSRLSPPVCEKKVPETAVADNVSCPGHSGSRRYDRSLSSTTSSKEERQRRRGSEERRSSQREDEGRRSSRRGRSRRSRSRSGNSSDSDNVKRGSDGGRLKIDRERLRRRALENTVLRLDERCPSKLADMPCFKALGVRVSELEEICRRLARSRQSSEKAGVSSGTSLPEHHQGGNKDCGKKQQTASLDPASSSSVCSSSTAVRHPFQLRVEASTGASTASRFSGLLPFPSGDKTAAGSKPLDKKELLSAFPVSSGEFHRHQDNTSALALTAAPAASAVKAAVDTTVASPAAGIQISIPGPTTQQPVDNNQPLPPWLPVVASSSSSNGPSLQVAAQAASAVEQQQRVLQLGDWATAKLLAAKSAPQAALQQQQQQLQRARSPQAWVTKYQFDSARPITGGIGRQLMEKMGWRHGQGLGKRNEGPTEPLAIGYKTDRKGLASQEDKQQQVQQSKKKKNKPGAIAASAAAAAAAAAAATTATATATATALDQRGQQCQLQQQGGKHPVSVLMELAKQRRWPDPLFRQVEESGPPHDRCFVFSVRVFGTEYQPSRPNKNKKDAKASAATLALQKLGIVPTS